MDREVEPGMLEALARLGLLGPGETPRFARLTGGVSSDIWRVDLVHGPVCVKRALAKLRAAAMATAIGPSLPKEARRTGRRHRTRCTARAKDTSTSFLKLMKTSFYRGALNPGSTLTDH
jgi:hypothetical protein